MRQDKPSLTAAVVAYARGIASATPGSPCNDPIAVELVPAPFQQSLRLLEQAGPLRERAAALLSAPLAGLVRHIEVRTALIDEAVRDAVQGGVRQVVVLGAGLDARAWRMQELSECSVIEVDHPATQAWKRRRVEARRPLARRVDFLAVDFARTSLGDAMQATSHQPAEPTLWIWEGVTPYLPLAAIDATLTHLSRASARNSRLAITYLTTDLVASRVFRPLSRPVLALVSEPLLGATTSQAFHALLRQRDFEIVADVLPAEAAPRFGLSSRRGPVSPSERVAVATRT